MVEQEGRDERAFVPDASVLHPKPPRKRKRGGGGTVVAEPRGDSPVELRAFVSERHRESFVEIYQQGNEPRLVTAIEVLSPSNKKPGSTGQGDYLRKRQSLMLGDVHLIELDLLRGGQRMPMVDPWPDSPYVLMVARVDPDHRCQVWRGYSDRPLPALPVPLIEPDADLRIDLQPMVDTIYRRSRYGDLIDYSKPPAGLSPSEAALAAGRLKPRRR
jgi:hypothetical protein